MQEVQILPHFFHPLQIPERKGTAVTPGKKDGILRQGPEGVAGIIVGNVIFMLVIFHIMKSTDSCRKRKQQNAATNFHWQGRQNPGQEANTFCSRAKSPRPIKTGGQQIERRKKLFSEEDHFTGCIEISYNDQGERKECRSGRPGFHLAVFFKKAAIPIKTRTRPTEVYSWGILKALICSQSRFRSLTGFSAGISPAQQVPEKLGQVLGIPQFRSGFCIALTGICRCTVKPRSGKKQCQDQFFDLGRSTASSWKESETQRKAAAARLFGGHRKPGHRETRRDRYRPDAPPPGDNGLARAEAGKRPSPTERQSRVRLVVIRLQP